MTLSKLRFAALSVALVSLLCAATPAFADDDDCQGLVTGLLDKDNGKYQLELASFSHIIDNAVCLIQSNLSNTDAYKQIQPIRTPFWDAFESFSGSQQGSSLSSSGSTNAVTKPSGPTAMIEEFGGVNATQGTSSATFQWSPGTMLTNLALNGATYLCASPGLPPGCLSTNTMKAFTPLTFKVTVNTSNGSQTLVGTAATANTSPSQQVTVNTPTQTAPTFGGLTVQYSLFGSKNKASVRSLAKGPKKASSANGSVDYYANELQSANQADTSFQDCQAYIDWANGKNGVPGAEASLVDTVGPLRKKLLANGALAPTDSDLVQNKVKDLYSDVLTKMITSSDDACKTAIKNFRALFTSVLEAEAYEDFGAQSTASDKPELALEYDLNTPLNKPDYSSAKVTFVKSFGSSKQINTKGNSNKHSPNQEVHIYAQNVTAATTMSQKVQAGQALAKDTTAPWTLTITGTADIYNSQPPRTVPSASHLRDVQAGAEISYLFAVPNDTNRFRQLIGNVTAAAAYSYQDQTSPAMLTGPALTDFTDLPSSTKTAYAARGPINLGQARLGFGTGGKTTFPLAFTYSNRSELVVHPTWGVQFGVSYNLTSLFSSSEASK